MTEETQKKKIKDLEARLAAAEKANVELAKKIGLMETRLAPLDDPEVHTYLVELQQRHGEWLVRQAQTHNRTPENMMEKIVREAWANDPYRSGTPRDQMSTVPADKPL